MSRATVTEVAGLHSMLVAAFRRILEEGEQVLTKDGEVVTVTPKPATLNVIRAFLADNGIEAAPDEQPENLVSRLPFVGDEDRIIPFEAKQA